MVFHFDRHLSVKVVTDRYVRVVPCGGVCGSVWFRVWVRVVSRVGPCGARVGPCGARVEHSGF